MDTSMMELTEDELGALVEFRHDLHRHPETSGEERRTTSKIREFVSAVPECEIVDVPVGTGLVARISGTSEEVMLRADIDALPQTERVDVPWRSTVAGVMHACGHDVHATALCGAMLALARMKRAGVLLPTVDLVFQPAEETGAGARSLIEAGLFDRIHPAVCFGVHNWPSVDIGKVVCAPGARMAALANFDVVVRGHGGHGSLPHLNVDPIVCAAAIVQSLQTVVSRNVDPLDCGLLSISLIEGGSPVNRVADQVLIKGTVRSLTDATLERMMGRLEAIVHGTAQAYACGGEVIWGRRIPAVWNSPDLLAEALKCVQRAGCDLADAPATLVGEDFAYYQEHVPSFFFWVGSRMGGTKTLELHAPDYFADDAVIAHAARLYVACAAGR